MDSVRPVEVNYSADVTLKHSICKIEHFLYFNEVQMWKLLRFPLNKLFLLKNRHLKGNPEGSCHTGVRGHHFVVFNNCRYVVLIG